MPRRARHEVYVKIWPRPGPVDGRGCTVMSMTIPFARMHGCGNDFVVLDDRAGRLYPHRGAMAQAICHRRTGLGGDRQSVGEGTCVAVREDIGGGRRCKKK